MCRNSLAGEQGGVPFCGATLLEKTLVGSFSIVGDRSEDIRWHGASGSERGLSRPDPAFEHDPQHRDWRLTTVVFLESVNLNYSKLDAAT